MLTSTHHDMTAESHCAIPNRTSPRPSASHHDCHTLPNITPSILFYPNRTTPAVYRPTGSFQTTPHLSRPNLSKPAVKITSVHNCRRKPCLKNSFPTGPDKTTPRRTPRGAEAPLQITLLTCFLILQHLQLKLQHLPQVLMLQHGFLLFADTQ